MEVLALIRAQAERIGELEAMHASLNHSLQIAFGEDTGALFHRAVVAEADRDRLREALGDLYQAIGTLPMEQDQLYEITRPMRAARATLAPASNTTGGGDAD